MGLQDSFNLLFDYYSCVYIYRITEEDYVKAMKEEINKVVKLQEELDIDVLVHGEPEVQENDPQTSKFG